MVYSPWDNGHAVDSQMRGLDQLVYVPFRVEGDDEGEVFFRNHSQGRLTSSLAIKVSVHRRIFTAYIQALLR